MRLANRVTGYSLMSCFVFFLCVVVCAQSQENSVERQVRSIFEQSKSWSEIKERLSDFPREIVIQAIVDLLRGDTLMTQGSMRYLAYDALRELRAAQSETGYDQLVRGLDEMAVAGLCATALLDAPEEREPEAIRRVEAFLRSAKEDKVDKPGYLSIYTLNSVGERGNASLVYVDVINEILRDPSCDKGLRGAAARAILKIEGLGKAVERFNELDPVGLEVAILPLMKYFTERNVHNDKRWTNTEEELAARRAVRELGLRGARSNDKETCKIALAALFQFFGDELVVGDEATGYSFHPDYLAAYEYVAQNGPDQEARDGAKRFLEPANLERFVANAVRARDNRLKKTAARQESVDDNHP